MTPCCLTSTRGGSVTSSAGTKGKPMKADKALAEARVNDLLAVVLDGGRRWDVVEYVRTQEQEAGSLWFVAEGATPLSDAMIRKYLTRTYKVLESAHEKNRQRLFRHHVAKLN